MVIKATYADGTSELLTVKKTDCGYMAGDFNVDWSYYFFYLGIVDPTIINYGLVSGVFRIIKDCDESSYYIGEELFTYLNLPSPAETVYLINFYAKTIGAVLKNALCFN